MEEEKRNKERYGNIDKMLKLAYGTNHDNKYDYLQVIDSEQHRISSFLNINDNDLKARGGFNIRILGHFLQA